MFLLGQEFSYLFISTVEGLELSGKSFAPLKSLSNPYIFNTAVTRARSLVVAVGDPFMLIKAEDALGSGRSCWKEFVSRCIDKGTFNPPSNLRSTYIRARNELYNLIGKPIQAQGTYIMLVFYPAAIPGWQA